MGGHLISDILAQQILDIRAGGKYNMFDIKGVQVEANALEHYELVIFLEEHPEAYYKFIHSGERG